mmetsp:Transcript_60630/g.161893  ORF Transcript_60630/g.161893 Transcript_60630/m.161893 type:complete len:158 (+) Transcript_60630:693-1166(+)
MLTMKFKIESQFVLAHPSEAMVTPKSLDCSNPFLTSACTLSYSQFNSVPASSIFSGLEGRNVSRFVDRIGCMTESMIETTERNQVGKEERNGKTSKRFSCPSRRILQESTELIASRHFRLPNGSSVSAACSFVLRQKSLNNFFGSFELDILSRLVGH